MAKARKKTKPVARKKARPVLNKAGREQKTDFETLVILGIIFLAVGLIFSSAASGAFGAFLFILGLAGFYLKGNNKLKFNLPKKR